METLKCIESRRSARNFSSKKIKKRDLVRILRAGNCAPSAGNTQSWQFIVLDDREVISEIASATLQPEVFDNVKTAIVVCSKVSRLIATYPMRGELYAAQNSAAAIENMLLAATDLGIDSLWVGAFDEDKIKNLLKMPQNIDVHALIILGKFIGSKRKVSKIQIAQKVFYNRWNVSEAGKKSFPVRESIKQLKKAIKKK